MSSGNPGQTSGYKFLGFILNPAPCCKNTGATETPKKTVDEIAREVIQGKWGNGQDRKNRLTQAGYDYSAVQHRVNELV